MKILPTFLCSVALAGAVHAAGNLLVNGNFETAVDGWEGIGKQATSEVLEDGGNHYLSLRNDAIKLGLSVKQAVSVEAGQWLKLTGKMRVKSLTSDGGEVWHNARVQTTWRDEAGKAMTIWPPSPNESTTTSGWVDYEKYLHVPAGAAKLEVAPAMFYSTGEVDFDDLELMFVKEDDVPDEFRKK